MLTISVPNPKDERLERRTLELWDKSGEKMGEILVSKKDKKIRLSFDSLNKFIITRKHMDEEAKKGMIDKMCNKIKELPDGS